MAPLLSLQRIKQANPEFGVGDVAKALGAEWKTMSAEDKAPYEERARQDKVGGRAGREGGKWRAF